MKEGDKLYRAVFIHLTLGEGCKIETEVDYQEWTVDKLTKQGVWLTRRDKKKLMMLNAKNPFASKTKEQALDALRVRNQNRIAILKSELKTAQEAQSLFFSDK